MIKNKKKLFIIAGMAVLLVVTGILNYKLTNNEMQPTNTNATSANFFETFKEDRTLSRDSQLSLLNEIINSTYSTESEKTVATATKIELTAKMEKELILEGLIKAKGFDDAVVTIGSNYYNVIVKASDDLTSDRVNQILSVVISETGVSASSVKVIPIE